MSLPSAVLLRTQSDERLAALAREGHERAFEAIVERYRRPLLRACRRVLPEARAEDALQHALLAAWAALQRGDEVRDVRAWLFRIAHNTALNQLRIKGYDHEQLHDLVRGGPGPEEEAERRMVVRATLTGLAALPERQREALLQLAVQGRAQEAVARDLGLSEGAVRQLVHRARTQLRAAATAVTPMPVAAWLASAGPRAAAIADRVGELTGGGLAASAAKLGAVAVLAGGVAAGPAVVRVAPEDRGATAAGHAGDAAAAGGAGRRTRLESTGDELLRMSPGDDGRRDARGPGSGGDSRRGPSRGGDGRHGRSRDDDGDHHGSSRGEHPRDRSGGDDGDRRSGGDDGGSRDESSGGDDGARRDSSGSSRDGTRDGVESSGPSSGDDGGRGSITPDVTTSSGSSAWSGSSGSSGSSDSSGSLTSSGSSGSSTLSGSSGSPTSSGTSTPSGSSGSPTSSGTSTLSGSSGSPTSPGSSDASGGDGESSGGDGW